MANRLKPEEMIQKKTTTQQIPDTKFTCAAKKEDGVVFSYVGMLLERGLTSAPIFPGRRNSQAAVRCTRALVHLAVLLIAAFNTIRLEKKGNKWKLQATGKTTHR